MNIAVDSIHIFFITNSEYSHPAMSCTALICTTLLCTDDALHSAAAHWRCLRGGCKHRDCQQSTDGSVAPAAPRLTWRAPCWPGTADLRVQRNYLRSVLLTRDRRLACTEKLPPKRPADQGPQTCVNRGTATEASCWPGTADLRAKRNCLWSVLLTRDRRLACTEELHVKRPADQEQLTCVHRGTASEESCWLGTADLRAQRNCLRRVMLTRDDWICKDNYKFSWAAKGFLSLAANSHMTYIIPA